MEYLDEHRFANQNIEMVLYSFISFFIPVLLSHSQIITGTVVNIMLAMSAFRLRKMQLLPVIIMPSLGALCAGLLFGASTVYLMYMIPFIWMANAIYVKLLQIEMRYAKKLVMSSIAKSVFLFLIAACLFYLSIVPAVFLTAMGVIQLVTALFGGVLAYGILGVFNENRVL